MSWRYLMILGIPWVNGKVIYNAPFTAACVLHGILNLRSAVGLLFLALEVSLKALPLQVSVLWERWLYVFWIIVSKPQ